MKIVKFHTDFDGDGEAHDSWMAEVVADGRIWMAEGFTNALGAHSIGRIKPKDNKGIGLHWGSQLAKLIREFVKANLDVHLQKQIIGELYGQSEPDQPVIGLETRAVLAAILEELGDQFFEKELEAADDTGEKTSLETTVAHAEARGFAAAQDAVMDKLRELTSRRDHVEMLLKERQVMEKHDKFVELDVLLNSLGGKPFNLKETTK